MSCGIRLDSTREPEFGYRDSRFLREFSTSVEAYLRDDPAEGNITRL